MVKGVVIDRQTHRRVLGHQNRNKAGAAHTTANRVKAVLRRQGDIGGQLRQLGHVVLESLCQLCCGDGADGNREILLLHVSLGTGNDDFLKR